MVGRWLGRLPAHELDALVLVLALCGFMAPSFMLPLGLGLLAVAEVARRRRSEAGFAGIEIPAALVGLIYTVLGAPALVGTGGGPDWSQLGGLATMLVLAFIVWLVAAVVIWLTPGVNR